MVEAVEVSPSDLVWRKSSRSGQDHTNGNCVEVAFARADWRKSTRSSQDGSNGACVEVAFDALSVAVRDSKSPDRAILVLPESGWVAFLHVSKM
ncbi:DUF397 domain-containing protein [Actinophytocola oryzae]|uniref:DUF397 domain-containing protein n=1 Tax=Actinophytocola oryzae TaxID=502181 RepID=UPI0010632EE0|nr:DUF397 domain-containing protein [Actinophytocola oryzae]